MNKDNEFVSADKRDEFFICAYHVINAVENNILKSTSFDHPTDATTIIDYFDCNEGDIQSTTLQTEGNLFKTQSQVFNKSTNYYNIHSKPKLLSFDTLENDTIIKSTTTTNNNILSNSNVN